MDENARKESLRLRIKEMLRKVPDKINSASVDGVREFKKWYVATTKQVDDSRASVQKLEALFNNVFNRYQS